MEMKKLWSLDFLAAACLTVILLGTFSVVARAVTRILVKKDICPAFLSKTVFFDRKDLRSNDGSESPKGKAGFQEPLEPVNWQQLYPFEGEEKENTVAKTGTENSENPQSKCDIKLNFAFAEKTKHGINSWIDKNFCLRDFWIQSSRKIVHFLIGDFLHSRIITVGNDKGYVSYGGDKYDVSKHARAVIELDEFLRQNGIPFLYVQAPSKISPLDYEAGTIDFSNQNADEFLKLLKESDVNFIDMREELLNTGRDFHDFFYKTDHHWKAETGLFACPIIAKKVNEIAGIEIDTDVFDSQNFDFEIFKDSFLGSVGRDLTLANSNMEDITLITPKKDFDLQTELYAMDKRIRKASGGFETFIFRERLQTKETALTGEAYSIYMFGNSNQFIKNNSCSNDYRILFLGDSFTNMVEPFFALSVKNFDSLDLRAFDGSFKNYVRKNKPYDICILCCFPASFADGVNEGTWNFE